MDDASTDDTLQKVESFHEKKIRIIRHPIKRGVAAALNTGFSLARGDLLSWTSDDNLYHPRALEEMCSVLTDHPDIDVVYADCTTIDSDGSPIGTLDASGPDNLLHGNCVGACFLYRRNVHEALGGYAEDMFLVEDYDFWVRASLHFRLVPLHKNLYFYRFHDSSLTSRHSRDRVLAAAARSLERHLPKMRWASPWAKSSAFIDLARTAWRGGDKIQCARCLVLGALYSPPNFARSLMGWTRRRYVRWVHKARASLE